MIRFQMCEWLYLSEYNDNKTEFICKTDYILIKIRYDWLTDKVNKVDEQV